MQFARGFCSWSVSPGRMQAVCGQGFFVLLRALSLPHHSTEQVLSKCLLGRCWGTSGSSLRCSTSNRHPPPVPVLSQGYKAIWWQALKIDSVLVGQAGAILITSAIAARRSQSHTLSEPGPCPCEMRLRPRAWSHYLKGSVMGWCQFHSFKICVFQIFFKVIIS